MTSSHHNSLDLSERVERREVLPGQLIAWWLGGAGFIFKTSHGTQLFIDPYLSDIVNEIFNQGRAFPPPLTAEQSRPDVLLCTHWHEDHLDPASVPIMARKNPQASLLMPPSAMARTLSWGVPRRQITPLKAGQSITVKDIKILPVPARHNPGVEGWEVPDAVSLILEIDGLKIFFSGDTEYDTGLRKLKPFGIQAAFLCINGVGGNMNAYEAALLAWQLGATTLVPMHHYLWANARSGDEATLDPRLLQTTYSNLGGHGRVVIPVIGEEIVLGPVRRPTKALPKPARKPQSGVKKTRS